MKQLCRPVSTVPSASVTGSKVFPLLMGGEMMIGFGGVVASFSRTLGVLLLDVHRGTANNFLESLVTCRDLKSEEKGEKMRKRGVLNFFMAFALVGLLLPSCLYAIPVGTETTLTLTNVSPGKVVGVNTPQFGAMRVHGGVYNVELGYDNKSYDSFCIDFFHYAPRRTRTYQAEELGSVFDTNTMSNIYQLWDKNYSDSMSNLQAAALQVALWEVTTGYTHFTEDSYDVFSGSFSMLYGRRNQEVGNLANSFLDALTDDYLMSDEFSLLALTNPSKQNYLVSVPNAPVPEPGTMFLMGAGLAGTGLIRLRNKSRK